MDRQCITVDLAHLTVEDVATGVHGEDFREPNCITEDILVKAGLQKAMDSGLRVPTMCLSKRVFIWVCFNVSPDMWVNIIIAPAIPSGSVT